MRKLIGGFYSIISPPVAQEVKLVITVLKKTHPIIDAGTKPRPETIKKAAATASMEANFTSVMIDKQSDAFSRHIYTYEQGMNVVVSMLKRFETSHDERERQIFLCMIHNLFNEYRFFLRLPEGISEVLAFFRAS